MLIDWNWLVSHGCFENQFLQSCLTLSDKCIPVSCSECGRLATKVLSQGVCACSSGLVAVLLVRQRALLKFGRIMLVLCCNLGFPFLPKDCVGCQSLQHQEPLFVRPDSQEAVEAGREGLTSNDPTEFLDCQAWMADQLQHLFSQPIDWLDQGVARLRKYG